MYCPTWFHITRQGWWGRRGKQPEQDQHTSEIQINAEITTNMSTCDKRAEKAK
jgi:hypothetical protein